MNTEDKREITEQLSYAAYATVRAQGLHRLVSNDEWDSLADELAAYLLVKAEDWVDERVAKIADEKMRETEYLDPIGV